MVKKIWLAVSAALLLALGYAWFASPVIHAQGPFAQFHQARALPAWIAGVVGTVVLAVWGYGLLRKKDRHEKTGP